MSYNPNDVAQLKHVNALAQLTNTKLGETIKYVSASGNTVSFFKTADGSGTAAYTFDFPEEIFLDQAGTTLVDDFAWSNSTYPGSTNPNLDGKTVLVLAVKGDKQTNPTVKYSFVDLSKLIDTYTAGDSSIVISGNSIAVNVSNTTGNLLSIVNDGLFVDNDDTKVDKVTAAGESNIVIFGASGAIVDSGLSLAAIDARGKIDKVTTAVTGNFAVWGASGVLVDSGFTVASDSSVIDMLNGTFGAGSISSIS